MQWQTYNFDDLRQQVPVMQYKRLVLNMPSTYKYVYTPKLQYGYGFLLRNIMYKAGYGIWSNGGTTYRANYFIEIVKNLNNIDMQNNPIPLDVIGTPGHCTPSVDLYYPSPAPYDQDGYGLSMWALPQVKNNLILNIFYAYSEVVELKISTDHNLSEQFKLYLDLLLFGYLIPEKSLSMWR